jgi:site-specific recombinase XerD
LFKKNEQTIKEKKMPTILIDYLPAELRENKQWYVRYYAKNPATNKLHRVIIRLDRIKSLTERRRYGKRLVSEINKKLEMGWNPFLEQTNTKSYHNIYSVFETYLKVKERELKEQSIRCYKSDVKILTEFLEKKDGKREMYVLSFTQSVANEFMNYMYVIRGVSERRYNSMLITCKVLFTWMVQNNYINVNPFSHLKKKKTKEKKREVIPSDVRLLIKNHLEKRDKHFLTFLLIEFYSLLRPNEILGLRISDIDVSKQIITVRAEVSKNSKLRIATIPDVLTDYIRELNLERFEKNMFVFSDDLLPGTSRKQVKYAGRRWLKLRKELKLKQEYQMYSLRDSGIINLLQSGISPEEVAKQADHHSLAITSVYALHANKKANDQLKFKTNEF